MRGDVAHGAGIVVAEYFLGGGAGRYGEVIDAESTGGTVEHHADLVDTVGDFIEFNSLAVLGDGIDDEKVFPLSVFRGQAVNVERVLG